MMYVPHPLKSVVFIGGRTHYSFICTVVVIRHFQSIGKRNGLQDRGSCDKHRKVKLQAIDFNWAVIGYQQIWR